MTSGFDRKRSSRSLRKNQSRRWPLRRGVLGKTGKYWTSRFPANNDADPFLRHAGVMALVGIGDKDAITRAAADASTSVRLAALLAMRRLNMPEIAGFLNDIDKQIVLEAARAIYDVPIADAMTK